MRILIVEDETRMAAPMRHGLSEEGYAVDVTAPAGEAVWMGTENPYDAIVLDAMLPDGDGFDVLKRLRAAGRWPPVIMPTARDAMASATRMVRNR
jgi:two-component system OmpR family response regulator